MAWLVVDGYNIINKWPLLQKAKAKNIEFAREKLNTILQKYSDFKHIKTTVVYDGRGKSRQKIADVPEVIFSKSSETADTVIEYLVRNYSNPSEITVATDDNIQRNFIVTAGAWYISAGELESQINETLKDMRKML